MFLFTPTFLQRSSRNKQQRVRENTTRKSCRTGAPDWWATIVVHRTALGRQRAPESGGSASTNTKRPLTHFRHQPTRHMQQRREAKGTTSCGCSRNPGGARIMISSRARSFSSQGDDALMHRPQIEFRRPLHVSTVEGRSDSDPGGLFLSNSVDSPCVNCWRSVFDSKKKKPKFAGHFFLSSLVYEQKRSCTADS